MGSIVHKILETFTQHGITIHVGESETRTNDPDAQLATAHRTDGTPIHSGTGLALEEVMVLEHLLEGIQGNCLIIGDGLGWNAVALGLLLKGKGRVLALDACREGRRGDRGARLVDAITASEGLPLEVAEGVSPGDLAARVEGRLDGRLDLVLVDGLHSDEQQILDYEGVRPYLAPGALVLFHDVLNWRTEASFREIARRDGRGAALLHRTASGMGILYPLDAPYRPLVDAFKGEALPPRTPAPVWEARYLYLATLYSGLGQSKAAAKYLEAALAESAHPEVVWMAMATHHFDRQAWEECLSCTRRALELRPGWSRPAHFQALVARSRGHAPEEVWTLLAAALDLADVDPDLLLDAGFAALNTSRLEEADRLARQALEQRPDWAFPWHLRALAVRQAGSPPGAEWPFLSEALKHPAVTAELNFDAALAARSLGRMEEAEALAGRAAAMAPGWEGARNLLAKIRRMRSGG